MLQTNPCLLDYSAYSFERHRCDNKSFRQGNCLFYGLYQLNRSKQAGLSQGDVFPWYSRCSGICNVCSAITLVGRQLCVTNEAVGPGVCDFDVEVVLAGPGRFSDFNSIGRFPDNT